MPCFVMAAGHSFKLGEKGLGQAVVFTLEPPKKRSDEKN